MAEPFEEGVARAVDGLAGAWERLAAAVGPQFPSDLAATALGVFLGAGLALWIAARSRAARRRREQKDAGNLAVLTLSRLANDFVQARAMLLNYRELVLREQPRLPIWMHVKSLHFAHAGNLRFDLPSLAFLGDSRRGMALLERLIAVEAVYQDFFGLLRAYAAVADALRGQLAAAKIDPLDTARMREFSAGPGAAQVARAERLALALFAHVERSEAAFREAAGELPALLGRRFGRSGIGGIHLPTYTELRRRMEVSEDDLGMPPIRP